MTKFKEADSRGAVIWGWSWSCPVWKGAMVPRRVEVYLGA